ncbi:lysophospholipid acyltransferase 7, partial [Python bivittatus]|uniref:Lysophospholipid acyltransferase 7 n=1 Tax=Python bivittatus TaxID=176946 RepID=A0A9F5MYR9_PYTBI
YSHHLTLGWTFSYLFFFHKFTSFKYPQTTVFTKAVQLLLILKMVSVADEVQEFIQVKKQEVTSCPRSPEIGVIPQMPGLVEILCYSYCYVGLMTGLFYRYRTYHDWLNQPDPSVIPTWKPLRYRLIMIPVFATSFLAVSHFFPPNYVESDAFYERGLCFRLFYAMLYSFVFRLRNYVTWTAWTMFISAYWHGLCPGYHLSFLTIPFCLVAEEAMESGVLRHLSLSGRVFGDWIHWFLKMMAYDYLCVGFHLRTFEGTIRYWRSVYYCVHVGAVGFFVVGKVLGSQRNRGSLKGKGGTPENRQRQE